MYDNARSLQCRTAFDSALRLAMARVGHSDMFRDRWDAIYWALKFGY